MPVDVLFAGVATADLEAAMPWYVDLFGRSADVVVNDDEVMWRLADSAWLYLVRDRSRAGKALVALAVPDLDRAVAEIANRGLRGLPIEQVGDAGRKARFVDPEGNTLAFIQVVASADAADG